MKHYFMSLVMSCTLLSTAAYSDTGGSDAISDKLAQLSEHCCADEEALVEYLSSVIELPWALLPVDRVYREYGSDNLFSHYILHRYINSEYLPSNTYYEHAYGTPDQYRQAQLRLMYQALSYLDAAQSDSRAVAALAGHLSLLSQGRVEASFIQRVSIYRRQAKGLELDEQRVLLQAMFDTDELPRVAGLVPAIVRTGVWGGAQ